MDHHTQPNLLSLPPSAADFTPLSDHQASTPSVFFGAKPVLHAALGLCDLLISSADAKRFEIFHELAGKDVAGQENGVGDANSDTRRAASVAEMLAVRGVSGFVTSSSLILNSSAQGVSDTPENKPVALSIPYPCISLHATQRLYRTTAAATSSTPTFTYSTEPSNELPADNASTQQTQAIYLQLDMDPSVRERTNDDDGADGDGAEDQTVEILLVPQAHDPTNESESEEEGDGNAAKVKEIFEALSQCADLHPDPDPDSGDGSGGGGLASMLGFGGGMPGDGGWITSENAHEFEGQFGDTDGAEEENEEEEAVGEANGLGPGAGNRRTRDDDGAAVDGGLVGQNGDGEDTKWQRTG